MKVAQNCMSCPGIKTPENDLKSSLFSFFKAWEITFQKSHHFWLCLEKQPHPEGKQFDVNFDRVEREVTNTNHFHSLRGIYQYLTASVCIFFSRNSKVLNRTEFRKLKVYRGLNHLQQMTCRKTDQKKKQTRSGHKNESNSVQVFLVSWKSFSKGHSFVRQTPPQQH